MVLMMALSSREPPENYRREARRWLVAITWPLTLDGTTEVAVEDVVGARAVLGGHAVDVGGYLVDVLAAGAVELEGPEFAGVAVGDGARVLEMLKMLTQALRMA
jgi:hypothetical protein